MFYTFELAFKNTQTTRKCIKWLFGVCVECHCIRWIYLATLKIGDKIIDFVTSIMQIYDKCMWIMNKIRISILNGIESIVASFPRHTHTNRWCTKACTTQIESSKSITMGEFINKQFQLNTKLFMLAQKWFVCFSWNCHKKTTSSNKKISEISQ